jgi:hypothetical protein
MADDVSPTAMITDKDVKYHPFEVVSSAKTTKSADTPKKGQRRQALLSEQT